MDSEKLYDAITKVSDGLIDAAGDFCNADKRKLRKQSIRFAIVSLVTAAAILVGIIFWPDSSITPILKAYAIAEAKYPEGPQQGQVSIDYIPLVKTYAADNIRTFLSGSGTDNKAISPLNIYMALSMLAEITDGNSRKQLLDVLGCSDMEELRSTARSVWYANYRNDELMTNLLASSLWLNNKIRYNSDTLNTLADTYYASSYSGEMGSAEFDATLRNWLNEQTGGLVKDQISNISLDPLTTIALVTTVQFHGKWQSKFAEKATSAQTFHAPNGDIICDFMHASENRTYYWGDNFSAVSLKFKEGGDMKIILPDEGYTPDDLLADDEVLAFMTNDSFFCKNKKSLMVNMAIPKFDINSNLDLSNELKALGITDVFDAGVSDYSPLSDLDTQYIALSKVLHGTRVTIDEDGCTAAAYTLLAPPGAAPPPDEQIDFVVDRPFLFVINYRDNLPLFAGVVNQPIE